MKFEVKNKKGIKISKMLWGSFVEQMGRAIYGGIYDKDHPEADEKGFRKDVKEAVKKLNLPIIRYPGGNFVSGYDWKDGVGENRPVRLNLAWQQLEPNIVGLHEFYDWAKDVGSDVMMAINLGTGTIKDALELVEYCNFGGHSTLSDMRRKNGREKPFGFKYWCLGNEMDGIWQICNLPSYDYAKKAREVSKLIKIIDPEIKTTLVGSSAPYLPTYPEWEKVVLEEAFEFVDYISLHRYYDWTADKNIDSYISQYKDLDNYIKTVWGIVCDVKKKKKAKNDVYLSLDEWNIWHKEGDSSSERWLVSDRKVENVYNTRDAVLFANLIITMLQHSEHLKIGCLAQLINVIAPIMTENGKGMYLQPTYYPFMFASNNLKGEYLPVENNSERLTANGVEYESINLAVTKNEKVYAVLAVNNSSVKEQTAEIILPEMLKNAKCEILNCFEEKSNSLAEPYKVKPEEHGLTLLSNTLKVKIPPLGIVMIEGE